MKIAKILPAFVGFTLVPAAGTLAADSLDSGTAGLDFAAPTTQMSGSDFFSQGILPNLRWSVGGVYAFCQESTDLGTDLYGIDLKLSYFVADDKELFSEFSYLMGTNDENSIDINVERYEISGGYNYWFYSKANFSVYCGLKLGVSQYIATVDGGGVVIDRTSIIGGLSLGGAYQVTDDIRVRANAEYSTVMGRYTNDWYDDYDVETFVILSIGLEFKF